MNNLWSPHPPSAYTVTLNGVPVGLGAREEFVGRPGLWNMFWLHSTKVDTILEWPEAPELAPMDTAALRYCIQSVNYSCHGVSFETLCEVLPAEELIARVVQKNYNPPIRQFWDQTTSGWQSFVVDRLKSFKSLNKRKGVLIQGRFPLQNKS